MEVLFLHKYSGTTDLPTAVQGGFIYIFYSSACAWYALSVARPDGETLWTDRVGLGLALVGQLGNLYHHYLLASLRSGGAPKPGAKRYVVPRGGLFELVTCPHYFFEVIAWVGVGLASRHVYSILVASAMCSYLLARSKTTTLWYLTKLKDEYPASRKHMIPYLF